MEPAKIRLSHIFHLRDIPPNGIRQRQAGRPAARLRHTVPAASDHGPIGLLEIRQEPVVGHLILNPEADDQGNGHADSETKYVEAGVTFLLDDIPPGRLEIVSEHECLFWDTVKGSQKNAGLVMG
jgi:hypothetical protein